MTVNYETGEIVEPGTDLAPVDKSSAASVITYLDRARTWLSTAVEVTGPAEIAMAKAQIATAAEATKQLHLSKEIQDDAAEMVRRAEYSLRKATTRAQEAGEVKSRQTNLVPGNRSGTRANPASSSDLPSPKDFFNNDTEYEDANAMGALSESEFDEALSEARSEGNLSRANVARKAREKSGHAPEPAEPGSNERNHQEAELINAFAAIVKRSLTPKNVTTLSPKAKQRLLVILEDAIQTLKGTDQ